jgi:thioredoxin 2
MPRCAHCHNPLPWMVDADDSNFNALTGGRSAVLVDLWAPWCGPCRMVAPGVEEVTRRFAGKLKTVKVNVDQAPVTARRLDVQGVPTLLMIKDGQVIARQVGALPAPALATWVIQHLEGTPA